MNDDAFWSKIKQLAGYLNIDPRTYSTWKCRGIVPPHRRCDLVVEARKHQIKLDCADLRQER